MADVMWFRRDLRLSDHPSLAAAAAAGEVLPLFVLDPYLLSRSGTPRVTFMLDCLRELQDATDGALVVRTGPPENVVPDIARQCGAGAVHVTGDTGPYGSERDRAVASALGTFGVALRVTGSAYAVGPGQVRKDNGTPYSVFSPFYKAWRAYGWPQPAPRVDVTWARGPSSEKLPDSPPTAAHLPPAGELAGTRRLDEFLECELPAYDERRDDPGADATSRLSPYLRWGCVHPRTILWRLGHGKAAEKMRSELAWREFYADVLHHRPTAARVAVQPAMNRLISDEGAAADALFDAWLAGRTGYPIVDAGMRQLAGEAWVHNRVRMIVASFLVKDLHLPWQRGARAFMQCLVDGDLASNFLGWQWVAGTGTDPAPYFRVFNPVLQGRRHDPSGAYVRRWVPELRDVPDEWIHEPWSAPGGVPDGYPTRVVDHAEERVEALRRYAAVIA
ncbi:MAG: deoxyribodipyrimidine photo-lyase [Actinomycetota bacterium]